jgi:hypothetical protein
MSRRFTYYGSFASSAYFSDLFGMPDVAYSLRKLSPLITNCIRVRRSSDSTEQDIGFVSSDPNAALDTTALLSFVGANDGFIVTAYNHNTSGTDWTQTTQVNQAKIVSAGVLEVDNLLACITYASTSFISNSSISGRASVSMFRVVNTSDVQYLTIYGQLNSALYGYVARQGNGSVTLYSNYGTPSLFVDGVSSTPTTRGDVYTVQDGRKLITEINFNTTAWSDFLLGGNYTAGFDFTGKIPEVIIYFSDKSSTRVDIETNINNYYGVF